MLGVDFFLQKRLAGFANVVIAMQGNKNLEEILAHSGKRKVLLTCVQEKQIYGQHVLFNSLQRARVDKRTYSFAIGK